MHNLKDKKLQLVMRIIFFVILLLTCQVEATTETPAVIPTLFDYIKKCEAHEEPACFAGWNAQLNMLKTNQTDNDEFDEIIPKGLVDKINEVCKNNNFLYCSSGLSRLEQLLGDVKAKIQFKENEFKQQSSLTIDKDSRVEKIKQDIDIYKNKYQQALTSYNDSSRFLCSQSLILNTPIFYCLNFLESNKEEAKKLINVFEEECNAKNDISSCEIELRQVLKLKLQDVYAKNLINSYQRICLEKSDSDICVAGRNAARDLGMENDFLNIVCGKKMDVDNFLHCEDKYKIQNNLEQEEAHKKLSRKRYISIGIRAYLILEAIVIILIFLLRTQCPRCKKNFAFHNRVITSTEDNVLAGPVDQKKETIINECRFCNYIKNN